MLTACALCWMGVVLWILSSPRSSKSVLQSVPPPTALRALRVAGLGAIAASVFPLARELGAVLAGVGAVLVLMTALSVGVVLAPSTPRLFLASLPLAAIVLAFILVFG